MNYEQVITAERDQAMRLGIDGNDATSNAARFEVAKNVISQWHTIADREYARASIMNEPDVPEPFAAQLVIKHGGDLLAVVTDPDFRDQIQSHMPYSADSEIPFEDQVADELNALSGPFAGTSYEQVMSGTRLEALQLGIEGNDRAANARRAMVASLVFEQWHAGDSTAYTEQGQDSRGIPEPFATNLVAEHGGDLTAVVNDPQFREHIEQSMGYVTLQDGYEWDAEREEPVLSEETWATSQNPEHVANVDKELSALRGAVNKTGGVSPLPASVDHRPTSQHSAQHSAQPARTSVAHLDSGPSGGLSHTGPRL